MNAREQARFDAVPRADVRPSQERVQRGKLI
jgi:hypothetical protein